MMVNTFALETIENVFSSIPLYFTVKSTMGIFNGFFGETDRLMERDQLLRRFESRHSIESSNIRAKHPSRFIRTQTNNRLEKISKHFHKQRCPNWWSTGEMLEGLRCNNIPILI